MGLMSMTRCRFLCLTLLLRTSKLLEIEEAMKQNILAARRLDAGAVNGIDAIMDTAREEVRIRNERRDLIRRWQQEINFV